MKLCFQYFEINLKNHLYLYHLINISEYKHSLIIFSSNFINDII